MANILLLGSDRRTCNDIRSILRGDGHWVRLHRKIDAWAECERDLEPDLIVAAADSIERILRCSRRSRRGFLPPILWIQQMGHFREPFLKERLVDRIVSPFMSDELLARVEALIRVRDVMRRRPVQPLGDAPHAGRLGLGGRVARWLGAKRITGSDPREAYAQVTQRVAEWADRRDAFEPGHADRVAGFCSLISEGLQMGSEETSALIRAGMLHDIGKIGIPVELLHQKGPLHESQTKLIRTHPRRGAALLRALDPDAAVSNTILFHHECPNGTGYYGRWMEVPRTAKALAVAEVYDAMTSSQLRGKLTKRLALDRLQRARGETLDSDCVDALTDRIQPRRVQIVEL